MKEEYFYKEGQISVTKALIRYGDASFAVANIGSVSIGKQNTQLYGMSAVILLTFSALVSVAAGTSKKIPQPDIPAILCVIAATLIIGATLAYLALKPKFYLTFRSSGGGHKSIETRNYAAIGPLKFAIEQAIIARG